MNITFEEAYKEYLKYVSLKQKNQSIRSLNERFNKIIIPFFKDYRLNEITINNYIDFQKKLLVKKYSYNYLKNIHYLCTAFFDYCMKYLNLEKNIARIVGNFKNMNNELPKSDYYTIKEFKKFIKNVDRPIYKQFFEFMFYTGTRPGEAMALNFNDLNYKAIYINKTIDEHGKREIGSTKTLSSNRIIGIDNRTYKSIIKLKKYYKSNFNNFNDNWFIFGGEKPLAPTTINRIKIKAANAANVKIIRLHDFRHSHATLLNDKNIQIKVISKRLGHSNINTTLNTYIHSNLKQEKRVLNTLNWLHLN